MAAGRTNLPAFGDVLRRHRLAATLTQEQLADRAEISARAVSDLERGFRQYPRQETAHMLASALGLDGAAHAEFMTAARKPLDSGRSERSAFPWRGVRLPAPTTPLIGREQECSSVVSLLRSETVRLVTLIGPGGVGKTRLAIAAAKEIEQDFADGAVFIDLAPLTDHRLVLSVIASGLGIQETAGHSLWQLLLAQLGSQHLLLVLDTFERVTEAALDVAELLAASTSLTILITSRDPLRLRAERQFRVPPLLTPDVSMLSAPTIETLAAVPSVALLVDRIQAVQPDFALSQETAGPAATICRRVDGLPLAIELAAARGGDVPLAELARRLERGLADLADGPRDLPERQRTLWATLAWSYDLLDSGEQRLLRQLSVFAGHFTREAAGAIVDLVSDERASLPTRLSTLVNAHMAEIAILPDGTTRYRLPDIVREFAAALATAEGDAEPARARHARYFRDLAETADAALSGTGQRRTLDRLEIDHDNMRSAITWALQREDADTALRLTAALWSFWETRGHLTEGRSWLDRALAAGEHAPAPLRAKAMTAAAGLADVLGDYDGARELYENSIPLWRATGDRQGLARALNNLGIVWDTLGEYERAAALYGEALTLHRQDGHVEGISIVLNNLGTLAFVRGDYQEAAALHEESLALRQQAGDEQGIAASLTNVAAAISALGDDDRAEGLLVDALSRYRSLGNLAGIASVLLNLGVLAHWRREFATATRRYEEALSIRRRLDDAYMTAVLLNHLADLATDRGDEQRALDLNRQSLAMRQALDDRVGIAGSLLGFADIAFTRGDDERAARLIGASEAIFDSAGHALHPRFRAELDHESNVLRDRIGEAAYTAAVELGRSRSLESAIAEAMSIRHPTESDAGNPKSRRPSPDP